MDAKLDFPTYNAKMELDATMDWLHALINLFCCEDILENQRVKIAKSMINGSTLMWWNFIQDDRVKKKKNPVTTWKKIVTLLKETCVHEYYVVKIHKKRMSLRQKEIDISTHT